jgi:pSer/pThr/pTyr-binding forkhead associated (FHA) protein
MMQHGACPHVALRCTNNRHDAFMTEAKEHQSGEHFFLRHASGERSGTVLDLEGDRVTIGRSLDNLCPLLTSEDRGVSLQHCDIRRTESGFDLVDCNSLNGTWLNGRRIRHERLHEGDVISLGRKGPRLIFSLSAAPRGRSVLVAMDATGLEPAEHVATREATTPRTRPKLPRAWRMRSRLPLFAALLLVGGGFLWWFAPVQPEASTLSAEEYAAAALHAHGLARLVLAEPDRHGGWLHTDIAPALIAGENLVLVAGRAFDFARDRLIASGGRLLVAPEAGLASAVPLLGVRSLPEAEAALLETAGILDLARPPRFALRGRIALSVRMHGAPQRFSEPVSAETHAWRFETSDHAWDLVLAAEGVAGLAMGVADPQRAVSGEALGHCLVAFRSEPTRPIR